MVAETDRPKLLFETGLPTRYYMPPEAIRQEASLPDTGRRQQRTLQRVSSDHLLRLDGRVRSL